LNQNAGCNKVKDGMDIALCAIDKENKTICFSGANNPLYYIHNGELEIIKGNRFPVGAYIDEELQEFTNHRFKYIEGDIIYLFSDGYADQFGGEYGKKYMSKNFKNLIMSIYSKPMQIQKEILEEEFVRWKGDEEQIDDVLVIGIRL
jgi:serine phosphatase RsbU (regulator of sigma subunit)